MNELKTIDLNLLPIVTLGEMSKLELYQANSGTLHGDR